MKDEDFIRQKYRSYVELWACSTVTNKSDKDILYGAILALGRVLEFNGVKIHKDMEMARVKYAKTIYS
jgi:hypothetical protein